ncbi:RING/FYVE/PHD zinc finger superfamily protein [Striga hermonthica]|uniref:RING/FYVE/PHD zinc finger superfamily protein n=1 Tax=Striga hermonthica TaxID=68872 RepID=A0A9N7RK75_STRHE|nr:RING/FYVE/PHD zinc finger superfamily protein [Striga hermonthica]
MREISRGAEQFATAAAGGGSRIPEVAIAIGDDGISDSNLKPNASDEAAKRDVIGDERRSSFVIDVKRDSQRICRICHLSAKESGKTSPELIELGCGCKGELGVAHSHCAEAWFRLKGNRLCEICGETAENITVLNDAGFMEEWNESRLADTFSSPPEGNRRCLHGQPLCNFLMACLVIAFVLPWFFRVNMF